MCFVIGWFRYTSPDTEVASTLPLRYNDSFDMCPKRKRLFPSHISVTAFTVSIFQIYHRVVSINRPSGYEPDALPLRHDDGCHCVVSPALAGTLPLRFNDPCEYGSFTHIHILIYEMSLSSLLIYIIF